MIPYNVEIFTPEFTYRSSAQVEAVKHAFDYLDIEKTKIEIPGAMDAQRGDWIHITRDSFVAEGIVSKVNKKNESVEVEYKPFHKIFDMDIYMDPEELSSVTMEQWLADMIARIYVNNEDELQNIKGLEIKVSSGHHGTALSDYGKGINNLLDVILTAFFSYGIVCNFSMNIQKKKLVLTIGSCIQAKRVIEADLPNVLEKEIIVKEEAETTNKLVVYNEEDYSQKIVYYRDWNNDITTENANRVQPVVCEEVAVKAGSKTFEEAAQSRAEKKLKPSQYDNLIEIKVTVNDELIRPTEFVIGQQTDVIQSGVSYSTVFTGMKYDGELITLIFGAVRLELTKTLKRRFRTWQSK